MKSHKILVMVVLGGVVGMGSCGPPPPPPPDGGPGGASGMAGGPGGTGGMAGGSGGTGGMAECERSEDCDDGNECIRDLCTNGACEATQVEDGTSCNGGADRCEAGQCVTRKWGTAEVIETSALPSGAPEVAMDGSGNAVAVWQASDGTRWNIGSNRYTQGVGWGTAEVIEIDTAPAEMPQVAMDPDGNALAVWRQNGPLPRIGSNRHTPSGGWDISAAEWIEGAGFESAWPQVAIDPSGNALVVWHKWDGMSTNIWSNRYTPSGGWVITAAELIGDNPLNERDAQVAMDPSGNALAVWRQWDGTRWNIWSNRYAQSGGWHMAEGIEANNAGDAEVPQVAMDRSANALAVWQQWDGTRWSIGWNRYTLRDRWGTAAFIPADDTGNAGNPQVAIDANGNVLAVWQQLDDGGRWNIWSNRYAPSAGWGTADLVETDDAGDAEFPQVAIDANGNALAVWQQRDDARWSIWSNRHTPSAGWGTAELIETEDAGDAEVPQVALDRSGNAVAVWQQESSIWSNRFE